MAVAPHLLTVEAVESLDLLEPCGTGNPRPVFLLQGAQVHAMSQVGRGRHLNWLPASTMAPSWGASSRRWTHC